MKYTHVTDTSKSTYLNPDLSKKNVDNRRKVEITFHQHRNEKFTRREAYQRCLEMGFTNITFGSFKSRCTELLRDNYLCKRGKTKENGVTVEVLMYGSSLFGKTYTMFQIFEMECCKVIDKVTMDVIRKNTEESYNCQKL